MLDAITPPPLQRSRGEARVAMRAGPAGRARLADLHQAGSAKAFLPRSPGDVAEVVFLNTSGGLTGGDRLAYHLDVGAGTRVLATTQTAERSYASTGAVAEVAVTMTVGQGARLDWLPQETILYDAAALRRRTVIDLAADAGCLLAESLVLGRQAMGEVLRRLDVVDRRLVRRQGRPVWAENLGLTGAVLAHAENPALLAGARALAVVALVAPGAEDAAGPLRGLLDTDLAEGAVSGWDGRCIVRLMARDGWPLQRQLARILAQLNGGRLPRVWQGGDRA